MQDREQVLEMEVMVKLKFIGNIKFIKMKKIFIIIVLLLSISSIKAQGNLQFNQVKNIEITGTTLPYDAQLGYPISTIGTITVPLGKVWKIESISSKENSLRQIAGIGSVTLIGNLVAATDVSNSFPEAKLPIWLSSGSYPIKISSAIGTFNIITAISAIEFNIVP